MEKPEFDITGTPPTKEQINQWRDKANSIFKRRNTTRRISEILATGERCKGKMKPVA